MIRKGHKVNIETDNKDETELMISETSNYEPMSIFIYFLKNKTKLNP